MGTNILSLTLWIDFVIFATCSLSIQDQEDQSDQQKLSRRNLGRRRRSRRRLRLGSRHRRLRLGVRGPLVSLLGALSVLAALLVLEAGRLLLWSRKNKR